MNEQKCVNCDKPHPYMWTLSGYYGLWGKFCSTCYSLVTHDSNGNPKNKKAYLEILEKQRVISSVKIL